MNLPIFEIILNDEEQGVDFISLVDEPAMNVDFLKFNKNEQFYFKAERDKKMLYGVFIMADFPVYRNTEKWGEIYTLFKPDTILKIQKRFNKKGYGRNINFNHGDNIVKAYVVDDFIVSDLIKPNFGFDVNVGSWCGSIFVEDDDFWNNYVKNDIVKGFSVELTSTLKKIEIDYVVEKKAGESVDEFVGRCIKTEMELWGYDLEQAQAICLSKAEDFENFEVGVPHYTADGKLYTGPTHMDASGRLMTGVKHTADSEYLYHYDELDFEVDYKSDFDRSWNDYPKAASNNAQRALDIKKETGIDCGTLVGWARANQLAKGEKISRDTIQRMANFIRHQQHKNGDPKERCGPLMWLAWGGDEGINWAKKKIQQLKSDEFRYNKEVQLDKLYNSMVSIVGENKSIDEIYDELKGIFK